jgi:hypothetical protein
MRSIEPHGPRRTAARTAVADPGLARAAAAASPLLLTLLIAGLIAVLFLATGCAPDGSGETVQVSGILTGPGTGPGAGGACQTMTSEDGELYSLTGDLGDVQSGDMVEVTGTLGDDDECDEGIVVRVSGLEVVAGPNTGERVGDLEETGDDSMDGVEGGSTGETPVGEPSVDGQLLLEGELTDEGVECQAFRSDDGELYTLTGDTGDFTTGERVRIVATPVDVSTCQQGQTVEIVEIGLIEEDTPDSAEI